MAKRKRKILWSLDARNDVSDIWDFYHSVAGQHTADLIVHDIDHACELIGQHPFAGKARDEVGAGFRSIVARPHVIFYRVNAETPEIIRVLDVRRDTEEIFRDEG